MTDTRVQVVAGVIARQDTILVCQRPIGGHHPGKWEFPGGKVEPGERLEQALNRELHEELDIDAVVGRLLWHTQHQYEGRSPFVLSFFAIPRFAGTVTNRCFAALHWVPVDGLAAMDFLEGDREFIDRLANRRVRLD